MAIYTKNIQPVNEVYFGDKTLEPILKQLGKVRSKNIETAVAMHQRSINSDPEMLKLNRMFEDQFGFSVFSLSVINERSINAFTFPIAQKYDVWNMADMVETSKNDGYKFKKSAGYCATVFIYSGIFLNKEFTDREVLAIILHEIGHNFQEALNNNVNTITTVIKCFNALIFACSGNFFNILVQTNSVDTFIKVFEKELRSNNNIFVQLYDMIANGIGFVNDFLGEISAILINAFMLSPITIGTYIANKVINMINNPLNILYSYSAYNQEQIADNFPTMYGYGADLSSALSKFEFTTTSVLVKGFNKLPLWPEFANLVNLVPLMILEVFDEHPVVTDRVLGQIEMLERELKREDMDPKMKKEIQKNIDEIKTVKDKYLKAKDGIKDPHKFRRKYLERIYELGGSGKYKRKSNMRSRNYDQYDSVYKNKLK